MGRKVRIHKNCGGIIKNDQCLKCGKKFGRLAKALGNYYKDVDKKFSPTEYINKIRSGNIYED